MTVNQNIHRTFTLTCLLNLHPAALQSPSTGECGTILCQSSRGSSAGLGPSAQDCSTPAPCLASTVSALPAGIAGGSSSRRAMFEAPQISFCLFPSRHCGSLMPPSHFVENRPEAALYRQKPPEISEMHFLCSGLVLASLPSLSLLSGAAKERWVRIVLPHPGTSCAPQNTSLVTHREHFSR